MRAPTLLFTALARYAPITGAAVGSWLDLAHTMTLEADFKDITFLFTLGVCKILHNIYIYF